MNFWNFTRSPASVRLLLDFGRAQGLTPAQLLSGSRLTQARLQNAQVSVSAGQELSVIGSLLRLSSPQPGMGLRLGSTYHLAAYGVLGLGLMSSATGVDALRLSQRFLPLTYAYVSITHRREGEYDILLFEPPARLTAEVRTFVVERAMGATVRLLRDIIGADASPSAIRLRGHAAAPAVGAELARLLGCRPQWGTSDDRVCIAHRLLQRPLPQANAVTVAMCERMCAELVERRRTQLDTATLVREYLASVPDQHTPKLTEVAALLCTSERTLKRWFRENGTTFRELLAHSRRTRADRLLRSPGHSLTDIAVRLGFSDLSSFSQAYKRWTGTTPSLSPLRAGRPLHGS